MEIIQCEGRGAETEMEQQLVQWKRRWRGTAEEWEKSKERKGAERRTAQGEERRGKEGNE